MAYTGYDSRLNAAPRSSVRQPLLPPIAWGRLIVLGASVAAWVGIIAAMRALF
ncbi:hypothetical protein [Caulobacter sp. DWR2-3-1b2]|uniref:hypothetical protein n=1 Tax=unclassified Caulobacter TaxID=2648921 RepID=UPI003CF4EAD5